MHCPQKIGPSLNGSEFSTGMAKEKLHPTEPTLALQAYTSALPLFRVLLADVISIASPRPSAQASTLSLTPTITTTTPTTTGAFNTLSSTASAASNPSDLSVNDMNALTSALARTAVAAIVYRGGAKHDYANSFAKFRELWRWVERIIRRSVILLAKAWDLSSEKALFPAPDATGESAQSSISHPSIPSLWTWLEHYSAFSPFWPPRFRAKHRSTVCVIYLRALVLKYGSSPLPPPTSSQTPYTSERDPITPTQPHAHLHQPSTTSTSSHPDTMLRTPASTQPPHSLLLDSQILGRPNPISHPHLIPRQLIVEYRDILDATHVFPHAGARNWMVEEFVDLCVGVWEVLGEGGTRKGGGEKNSGEQGPAGLAKGPPPAQDADPLTPAFIIDVSFFLFHVFFWGYQADRVHRPSLRRFFFCARIHRSCGGLLASRSIRTASFGTSPSSFACPGTRGSPSAR